MWQHSCQQPDLRAPRQATSLAAGRVASGELAGTVQSGRAHQCMGALSPLL